MPEAPAWLHEPHKYLIASASASAILTLASGAAHFLAEDGLPRFLLYSATAVVLFVHVALHVLAGTSRALDHLIEVKDKLRRLRL